MILKFVFLLFLFNITSFVESRKHHLEVRHDDRPYIALSTFGFYTNGHLDVELNKLIARNEQPDDLFGLTLDKTTIDVMNPYLDAHQNKCILEEPIPMQNSGPILFFKIDLKNLRVDVRCSPQWKNFHIYKDRTEMFRQKRQSVSISDSPLFIPRKKRDILNNQLKGNVLEYKIDSNKLPINESSIKKSQEPMSSKEGNRKLESDSDMPNLTKSKNTLLPVVNSQPPFAYPQNNLCKGFSLPLIKSVVEGETYYNMSFSMFIASLSDEGLYNLYFHACPNYRSQKFVSFNVDIEENNNGNYLSAGEMPLPALYFMMSILFFLSGMFWLFILKKSKHNVYKIHYIMTILVFLKSLSLMFHSINYHFIEKRGEHVETWAILYYIAHLLKGAVLFITIVLIGTGWTFIKHILSDKDKKIFMIVIPLQIFANVAQIITDESEESDAEFHMWRNIFFFVDLLCCGFILFPIVWSIRHLHEASATDGKAAINLKKLKLFRQFYIMIVCYIYFTRIIVDLLKMTVAFQYAWLDEMFHEMATYVFFVLTGYKFRPVESHPYFSVPDECDEVEILTNSGLTEGLHRTKAQNRNVLSTTTVIEGNEDELEVLVTKRESSHEYD